MRKFVIATALLATCGWLLPDAAFSKQTGISGRSTAGCGGNGCHVGAADPSVTVTLSAPSTFAPGGAPAPMLVTLLGGPNPQRGGFNLLADVGTLTPIDANLLPWGPREISHTFITSSFPPNSPREWAATWTPPAIGTICSIPFSVAGNAVNGNGAADAGDKWNLTKASAVVDTANDQAAPTGAFRLPKPGFVHFGQTTVANAGVTVVFGAFVAQITANDDVGIALVELFDEDLTGRQPLGIGAYEGLVDNNTRNLFTVFWDVLQEPPGPHTLVAEITDCTGKKTTIELDVFVL